MSPYHEVGNYRVEESNDRNSCNEFRSYIKHKELDSTSLMNIFLTTNPSSCQVSSNFHSTIITPKIFEKIIIIKLHLDSTEGIDI